MPHPWKHSRSVWMGLWATRSSQRHPCSLQSGWTRWPLKAPSNTNHSMMLWGKEIFALSKGTKAGAPIIHRREEKGDPARCHAQPASSFLEHPLGGTMHRAGVTGKGKFSSKHPQLYKDCCPSQAIPGARWHASHHSSQAPLSKCSGATWGKCW